MKSWRYLRKHIFFSHHHENIMLPRIPRRRTTHPTNTTTDEKMPRSLTLFPYFIHICTSC
jgi:hypothetical protein